MNRLVQTYVMKSGNKYKIGKSEDTSKRLKALQTGNPDINLILSCEESKVSEKALHNMFSHKRVSGEWFSLTASDIQICKNLMGDKLPSQKNGKVSCTFHLYESTRRMIQEKSFTLKIPQNKLVEDAILEKYLV